MTELSLFCDLQKVNKVFPTDRATIIIIKRSGFDPAFCPYLINLSDFERNISQIGGDVTQPCP